MTFDIVGTPARPLHLKLPDGSWRTYAQGSGVPLWQKQRDGTWLEVARAGVGAPAVKPSRVVVTFSDFNLDPLPAVSSDWNATAYHYGDVVGGSTALSGKDGDTSYIRTTLTGMDVFPFTDQQWYVITARAVTDVPVTADMLAAAIVDPVAPPSTKQYQIRTEDALSFNYPATQLLLVKNGQLWTDSSNFTGIYGVGGNMHSPYDVNTWVEELPPGPSVYNDLNQANAQTLLNHIRTDNTFLFAPGPFADSYRLSHLRIEIGLIT